MKIKQESLKAQYALDYADILLDLSSALCQCRKTCCVALVSASEVSVLAAVLLILAPDRLRSLRDTSASEPFGVRWVFERYRGIIAILEAY
jgi:hypothetical protein